MKPKPATADGPTDAGVMISLFARWYQRPGQVLRLHLYAWVVGVRVTPCATATRLGQPGRHRVVALEDQPVQGSYAECWRRQQRLVELLSRAYPLTHTERYGD